MSTRVTPTRFVSMWIVSLLLLTLVPMYFADILIPAEGTALGGLDVHGAFYPWFSHIQSSLRAGQLPFWDAYQFAGNPFLANAQLAVFYPPVWLMLALPLGIGLGF